MADYTYTKETLGALHLVGEIESVWGRLEPLLTPDDLLLNYLFGLDLTSAMVNSVTKKKQVMTNEMLKRYIERAVSIAEQETHLIIMPTKIEEKLPFDKPAYESLGYMVLKQRPVSSIERVSVNPANNTDIFVMPLEWIETANLPHGQLNILPLTLALTTGMISPALTASSGGALFLAFLGQRYWIPAFWKVSYTAGFPNGNVPRIVNELIGTIVAMEVLSMLAPTYAKTTGASLSMDGVSQSVSTPGPGLFKVRLEELGDKRKRLVSKLKAEYGQKIFSDNV